MGTSQVDRVPNSSGAEGLCLLDAANLTSYRFSFRQTCLAIDLDNERYLSIVILLSNALLKDNTSELTLRCNIENVPGIDALLVKILRRPVLQPLIISKQHSFTFQHER